MSTSPQHKLKVAVLNRSFAKRSGGAESYSVQVVEQLAATHDIHVFAQEFEHAHDGVTYHRIARPFKRPRWINQLWFSAATWWHTRRGFDVVHSHEHVWHGQVQTLSVRLLKHNLYTSKTGFKKFLSALRVLTSPRLLAYWWLEAARLKPCARRVVVAVSAALRDEIAQAHPASLAITQIITPGVDVPHADLQAVDAARQVSRNPMRRAWGVPDATHCVLFVANDFARKGLDALLQAMVLLPGDVHAVVVGRATHAAQYGQMCEQLGLSERVHFLGSQTDMNPIYLACDALAYPTLGDTYGMVPLEAMALGLPVVVSGAAWCGMAQELNDGVQALLLNDPREPQALAQALEKVLKPNAAMEALREQAFAHAKSHDWAATAARYAKAYEQVALKSVG